MTYEGQIIGAIFGLYISHVFWFYRCRKEIKELDDSIHRIYKCLDLEEEENNERKD